MFFDGSVSTALRTQSNNCAASKNCVILSVQLNSGVRSPLLWGNMLTSNTGKLQKRINGAAMQYRVRAYCNAAV